MSRKGLMISALNLCIFLALCVLMSCACAEKSFVFQGVNYVLPEDSDFDYSKATAKSTFFYGAKTENTEEMQALPGSEIDKMIHQIDELIEGDYAQAVYNYYSRKSLCL